MDNGVQSMSVGTRSMPNPCQVTIFRSWTLAWVCLLFVPNICCEIVYEPYPNITETGSQLSTDDETKIIHFIGLGYNIYKGNPDGKSFTHGSTDPGIRLTRSVLRIDSGNTPQQISISRRHGCQYSHDYNLIYNPKTYQDKLKQFVMTPPGASQDTTHSNYAFTLSSDYNDVLHETENLKYVFQDYTTTCDLGYARYGLGLAGTFELTLSFEFVNMLCFLPTNYSQAVYEKFVDFWGTDVISEVYYGKRATNRYRVPLVDYFSFMLHNDSSDVNAGGPLWGYDSSMNVDLDTFKYRDEFKYLVGSKYKELLVGGTDYYDNYKLLVVPLYQVVTGDLLVDPNINYVSSCQNKNIDDVISWKENIAQAIKNYPEQHKASMPVDADLAMPLSWPAGTFTLQKPVTGCPGQIHWAEGSRYELEEQDTKQNQWSNNNHFAGTLLPGSINLEFCTKIPGDDDSYGLNWPEGDYCIYKHGDCPTGFTDGEVYFDDEDTNNNNTYTGTRPDGIYGADTRMEFCCRSDGFVYMPIWLPTSKPFYLFKYKSGCQKVHGMQATEEYLKRDDENGSNGDSDSGANPKSPDSPNDTEFHYCYYKSNIQIENGPVVGK